MFVKCLDQLRKKRLVRSAATMAVPSSESIIALVIDTKGKAGIVANAILDGGTNPLARGS